MSTPSSWFQQTANAVQGTAGAAAANIAAGAAGIAAGAHNISAAASAGKLSLDPQVGGEMIKAIDKMLHEVRDMQGQVHVLGEAPKLGSSPDAIAMANHTAQVGSGSGSAKEALQGLHQALLDLRDGIDKSMKNYGHTDQGAAQNLNQTRH